MTSISDKIIRRVRSKGCGKWVCTPKDFLDIGSRAAVDRALSRLAKRGDLRRVGRGFYDLPRFSDILKCLAPVDIDSAVAAIVRRDGIRIMDEGMECANRLGLTNAVQVKVAYITDGITRNIKIGGYTVYLRHASPRVMFWAGKKSDSVAIALLWLGPYASQDSRVIPTLRQILPDNVKEDLIQNSAHLPSWAASIARDVVYPLADAA